MTTEWKLVPVALPAVMADALDRAADGGKTLTHAELWAVLLDAAPAAPVQQAEPVAWRVRAERRTKPGQFGPWRYFDNSGKPVVNSPDDCEFEGLYSHPPAAEVQRLVDALTEIADTSWAPLRLRQIARAALEGVKP